MSLKDLNHIHKVSENGVNVYALDTGCTIDAEAEAMLQALHSRSTWWITHHLKVLEEKGAENFMKNFYVGYGHKSIWDCGSMTLFVEWLSMLGAKAIQHSPLYSGQESSTRYIDFSNQKIMNPAWTDLWEEIQEQQRSFYLSILEPLKEDLKKRYPLKEWENQATYEKAISAKAFDIARWFLPAWTTTNLAWHSNLRQIADRILALRHHPLEEIRQIGETILDTVIEKYPSSFSHKKYEETEKYMDLVGEDLYFYEENYPEFEASSNLDKKVLEKYKKLIDARPNEKTELPIYLSSAGTVKFRFLLDFGSFRDVQRHRAVFQQMPLHTDKIWFNSFYIEQLPANLQEKAVEHLQSIKQKTDKLWVSETERQYYIPMWYNMTNEIVGTLPALVYLIELRSTRFVHPTLRKIAHMMGDYLEKSHNIKVFLDKSEVDFDIRRWNQTIEIKD